jgi:hypothetical protein
MLPTRTDDNATVFIYAPNAPAPPSPSRFCLFQGPGR